DFPTGCMICGVAGIRQYMETGRGGIKVRGKAGVEEMKGGKEQIVITGIPYNVNRAVLVEKIADLVNDKVLTDITAIRDESDENTRVVIELKRDATPKVIINNLYKHTAMESSFAVTMLAIDHGRPNLLSLRGANAAYIEHRRDVVLRRTRFELRNAEERAETLEGYLIALANLDEFLRIIRGSANRDEARVKLLAFEFTKRQVEQLGILIRTPARLTNGRYAFSEQQADEILNLRLYQLTGLEREKIDREYKDLIETIKDLSDILAKEQRVFTATTHDYLMFFTQSGRAYVEKVYEIPEMGRAAKGRSIANILELRPNEKIAATIRIQSRKSGSGANAVDQTWDENLHIVFAT